MTFALYVCVKTSYNLKRLLLFYKEYNFFCGSVASVFPTISFHWSDRHGTGLQVDFFRILPYYW
jgi:hypothetical protein